MPYAQVNGIKIFYEIYGPELEIGEDYSRQRPTLIALHGGPGIDHACYEVQYLKACSEFAQVIFIDHRGNGRSVDPHPENWNLTQWANDVSVFIETLGLEKPFVSGFSFGGWVAQKYAALCPEQPAGIILIDTEAHINQPKMFARFEAEWGPDMRAVAERYVQPNPPADVVNAFRKCLYSASKNPIPEQWRKRSILNPACFIHTEETITFSFNLLKDLEKITAPVLYLMSTINPFHILEGAEETRDALINAEVTFLPIQDCGLVPMDAQEQCVQEIQTFIQAKFNPN